VALTLAIGILIGSVVSGRTFSDEEFWIRGHNGNAPGGADPIPATNSFGGDRQSRGTRGGKYCDTQ